MGLLWVNLEDYCGLNYRVTLGYFRGLLWVKLWGYYGLIQRIIMGLIMGLLWVKAADFISYAPKQ